MKHLLAVLLLVPGLAAAQPSGFKALLSSSCLDCHDADTKKGGLSLEGLDTAVTAENAAVWQRCLEQIEQRYMPPDGKSQPSAAERDAAVRELEESLVRFHATQPRQPSVLRRLNRAEYRNTIRDLLQLELGSDPTAEFPGDQRTEGFASNGEQLVTSNFLLRKYLEAAEDIVSRAVHFEPRPATRHWDMKPPFDRTTKAEQGQAVRYYEKLGQPQPYQDICQRIGAGGAPYKNYHPLDDISADGVPVSGWYRIRIRVEAKFRHAFRSELFTRFKPLWDGSEPIRLALFTATLQGIDPENREAIRFAATYEQADQRHLATWDLPDDRELWVEARVWLERGQFPRLGFPNGPSNSNYRLNTYFKDLAKATLSEAGYTEFEQTLKKHGGWISFHLGESPRIRIYEVRMDGPLNDTWPPPSHRVIFGDADYDSANAPAILRAFAAKAWRRPTSPAELEPILQLVRHAEQLGAGAGAAIQEGIKAILCSPGFIYREEPEETLNDHELATRLSYFLTSSLPDAPLRQHAAAGRLHEPGQLVAEARRLLADPRSDAFVHEFLDGWLRLDKLGSMAPDPQRFRTYYTDHLEPAMRTETRLFFRQLLNVNGPIARLLDSDYTFANESLTQHYGVKNEAFAQTATREIEGLSPRQLRQDGLGDSPTTRFAMIQLGDRRRGGLLGQAAIHTLTANGVDTSPVLRGVWLLENILGTPPPQPPANVPAIEPDVRGATTIREQLQKHRASAACRSCHALIDPPGFALESFDPIGGWRGHYPVGNPNPEVDPSGRFGGREFADIIGFKAALLERTDTFARCLVEKLLLHALGRELVITDRPHIRRILEDAKAADYRLQDLVLGVVASDLFRHK